MLHKYDVYIKLTYFQKISSNRGGGDDREENSETSPRRGRKSSRPEAGDFHAATHCRHGNHQDVDLEGDGGD